ncbi:MAG TPA: hypothetical protein VF611_20655 [Pyrinomonadaceae bacterium]
MTTRLFSLFALCLLAGVTMLACGGGSSDNASNTAGGSAAGGSTASGDKIGVAECDDFIAKYEACVNSKVPETARSMVKANLDAMRTAWKKAAETPQGKAGLAQGCKQALEQTRTSMGSYGCSW